MKKNWFLQLRINGSLLNAGTDVVCVFRLRRAGSIIVIIVCSLVSSQHYYNTDASLPSNMVLFKFLKVNE